MMSRKEDSPKLWASDIADTDDADWPDCETSCRNFQEFGPGICVDVCPEKFFAFEAQRRISQRGEWPRHEKDMGPDDPPECGQEGQEELMDVYEEMYESDETGEEA